MGRSTSTLEILRRVSLCSCLCARLSVCLSVCLSVRPSVCVCVCVACVQKVYVSNRIFQGALGCRL